MQKNEALEGVRRYFAEGQFEDQLRRRVAVKSDSQTPEHGGELTRYLVEELVPQLAALGFTHWIMENPAGAGPILVAHRHESQNVPTVLTYGHGDVVPGYDQQWREGLSPWNLTIEGDRWYGRGTADNKGQHTINLVALEQVIKSRNGRLGFNVKAIFETAEERGSPGLRQFCQENKELLSADLFIASDGPRLNASRPTIFLGSRGTALFSLEVVAREHGLHSGNWGGVMTNPAVVLSNALACLIDGKGRLACRELTPPPIAEEVREAIEELEVTKDSLGRSLDEDWGEPGLTFGERLFGWNTLEILALSAGNAQKPVNAIPPRAKAFCNFRFVVGTPWQDLAAILRRHLDAHGYSNVEVVVDRVTPATRLDVNNKWVTLSRDAISQVTPKKVALVPNLAGTVPNDIFADVLGLPTVWIPHSYPGCSQHAPNEHLLRSVAEEGLQMMTSLFWELGNVSA
ncbi:M20 family metallopeptidase [Cupriavidus basilensis]|uniref:M20 family metallopeptidase n=1 Tax=Cupriavidus basilensis TaxID=68895 RepID=A0ABT6AGJ1_9BURK|nr:M20 family metallopeptidase [Cupriavidus basilensis]MDF3831579.1 M20 family metallopeptidase [Cupriavidus basilensis]